MWLQTVYSHLLTLVPRSRIFLPWRWRRYVPPKRQFTQDLHGVTSQKTAFFKLTFRYFWHKDRKLWRYSLPPPPISYTKSLILTTEKTHHTVLCILMFIRLVKVRKILVSYSEDELKLNKKKNIFFGWNVGPFEVKPSGIYECFFHILSYSLYTKIILFCGVQRKHCWNKNNFYLPGQRYVSK
jgi:hypothetical protein